MEKHEKETLVKEANEKYPIGTVFFCSFGGFENRERSPENYRKVEQKPTY